MSWLSRWFGGPPAAAPSGPRTDAPPGATAPVPSNPPTAALRPLLLPWLLDVGDAEERALSAAETQALAALDAVLALPALPDELLPRAAALIPQLLAMLRQTDLPVQALAQQVSKDVVLAAEVLRTARSPFYRARGTVSDLGEAITLVGEAGVQSVIARVLLRPIFEPPPGTLGRRIAARLWDHAERMAGHASDEARAAGQSAFDGYIAGLLHDAGWTVAARAIDRAGVVLEGRPGVVFCAEIDRRAHTLFGRAGRNWAITAAFQAFCADARRVPLDQSTDPLAAALRRAQVLAFEAPPEA